MVVGIIDESDKVYARPLYAAPRYNYGGKPIYQNEDMVLFTEGFKDRARLSAEVVLQYTAFILVHICWATLLRLTCELIATRDPTRTASLEERPVERYSCLSSLHDISLSGEVTRYHAADRELQHLNQRIDDLIAAVGEIQGKVSASRHRLEMANALERIKDEARTMVDYELTKKKTRRGRRGAAQATCTRILYEEEGFGVSGRRT
ncbi:hypothetical protein EDB86DRAFT_3089666 [Lactarius hatsudake]|nr:hypothetical protein EDB86DRAFT_3089666 [Lactarius hatsudake]